MLAGLACAPPEFEAGPLGAVEVGPGDDIQIRSISVLTGLGGLGATTRRGVALAVADYGPIKGHDVSMGAGLDSLCTAEGGRAAAETVIGDPRVVGVVGTSCSVAAIAALAILGGAGLVMISPTATAPSLTSDLRGTPGPDYRAGFYRTAGNDLYEGQAIAEYAYHQLGLRSVAAMHDGDPYTSGLAHAFAAIFERLGGSVSVTSIARGGTDIEPVLRRIAFGSPDGLFLPLFPEEAISVVEKVAGIPDLEGVTMIGGAALLLSDFLAVPESEGIYLPGQELEFGGNTNEATGKSGERLIADYRETYGEEPATPYLAHAYDATTVLLRAIEQVAVARGGTLFIDRAELREGISGTDGFSGIIGTIACDDFGDCGTGRIHIAHHSDSAVVDPARLPVVYRFSP